jgi:hypothetical protein
MGNYVELMISCVDSGLEDLHFELGDLCPAQAADEFFGLAGKHGAANHFDGAAALMRMKRIFEKHKNLPRECSFKKCTFERIFSVTAKLSKKRF